MRLSFSFLVFSALAAPSLVSGFWDGNNFWNTRSGEVYTTKASSKAEFSLPGVELYISPKDSFDFLPSAGYAVESVKMLKEEIVHAQLLDVAYVEGSEDVATWAQTHLGSSIVMQKHEVPRPNESLSGKVLTVKSSKDIFDANDVGEVVICHKAAEDMSFCHKVHEDFSVTEVTVSPNGKPSTLWVGCHTNIIGAENWCHVMNVGDIVFTTTHTDKIIDEKKRLIRVDGK